MDFSALAKIGLTPGESRVYLALLRLGPSKTGAIVREARVARSIVYQLLDNLMQKGLVSYVTEGKMKHYQAADPQKIGEYLDEEETRLKKRRQDFSHLIPDLLALQHSAKQTEVKVFRGFRGMVAVHEHSYQKLSRGEEYFFINIPHDQPEYYHPYYQKDHVRRARAGIRCRLLFDQRTEPKVLANRNSYAGCDARYMPMEVNTPVWFGGYKDVATITVVSSDPITIEITNQEIADAFRAYFEEIWKKSRKFSKR